MLHVSLHRWKQKVNSSCFLIHLLTSSAWKQKALSPSAPSRSTNRAAFCFYPRFHARKERFRAQKGALFHKECMSIFRWKKFACEPFGPRSGFFCLKIDRCFVGKLSRPEQEVGRSGQEDNGSHINKKGVTLCVSLTCVASSSALLSGSAAPSPVRCGAGGAPIGRAPSG